jgi:dTDP-4-amino-4,6-dideoxygalactose transaminase
VMSCRHFFSVLCSPRGAFPEWPQWCSRDVLPALLGRVAIWQLCEIWRLGPGDEILMPAYNCGTEVDPFIVRRCKVTFYRVDENARIDFDDIMRRKTPETKVVYVTHYFGWPQDLGLLLQWCRQRNIRLVEDCALALFSSGPDGPLGRESDAAIYSLTKFLPVPDGGLLVLPKGRDPLPALCPPGLRQTWRRVFPWLKMLAKDKRRFFGLGAIAFHLQRKFQQKAARHPGLDDLSDMPADYYFNRKLANAAITRISLNLLQTVNAGWVVEQRRKNYLYFLQTLDLSPTEKPLYSSLPDGVCPLVFPLLVQERQTWMDMLKARGIDAYPWWAGRHRGCSWDNFPEADHLKQNLLGLPVHQNLSVEQRSLIADTVNWFSRQRREAPIRPPISNAAN